MNEEVILCKKCGEKYLLTTEHWKPNKSTKSGWSLTMCRKCFNEYCKERVKNNPEKRREKERKYKECNPEKAAAKLKRHHEKQRLEGKNKYCNRNIEKCRELDHKRWASNPERREQDRQRWEKRKVSGYNEHERERYKQNPLPKMLKANKRRVLKLNTKGTHDEQQLRAKYEYYGKRCYYCQKEISINELTEDHRIPLSKGGADWIANIVPACRSCNSRKGNKTESEYRIWLLEQYSQKNQGGDSPNGQDQL